MTDTAESRAAKLARTSEIYRRLRSTAPLTQSEGAVDLPGAAEVASTPRSQAPEPAAPPPKPPRKPAEDAPFLRRMLTRRIDAREVLLLLVTLAVLVVAYR